MIGSVYGAHLGAAGHTVSVLSPPPRTADVAVRGLAARDVLTRSRAETGVHVVPDPAAGSYDRPGRVRASNTPRMPSPGCQILATACTQTARVR